MSSWRADRVAFAEVELLRDALDCPEPLAWTLVRRGLGAPDAARAFLDSSGDLAPAERLDGVPDAAERLLRALRADQRIVVHGDYDCDGVVATALAVRALRARGGRVEAFLPSRFTDGYGVARETVERLGDRGCRLLVCVDCGTSAADALDAATERGMDVVVLDHHLAAGRRPPGVLVNPALGPPTDDPPAAAGVVFAVLRAMAAREGGGRLGHLPEDDIDLVALATVADSVPMLGDNRLLVARGLERLRRSTRPGIAALCAVAGADPRAATARTLGFTIAPAINAAGRLAHPERALELLLAEDEAAARPIAEELWARNLERRDVERAITEEAIAVVEAEPPERRTAGALVVAGDGWHEGVVGIVASRLAERFERPAIVLARDGERARGSGRSLPGVDLHALVSGADRALTRWGGHAAAIGVELPAREIARFRDDLMAAADAIRGTIDRARVRRVDAVIAGRDLTLPVAEALGGLAPFGPGNPAVRLVLPRARVEDPRRVGDGHLRMRLRGGGAHAGAVAFRWGARVDLPDTERRHDAIIDLGVDRYQDLVGPRVVVERLAPLDAAPEPPAAAACDLRPYLAAEDPRPEPSGTGAPLGIRDRRGMGTALCDIVALCGADRGVAVVTANARSRAGTILSLVRPEELGVRPVVVDDARAPDELLRATADGGPIAAVIDYEALLVQEVPAGVHVVALDPPAGRPAAERLIRRAGDRWLHVVWGPDEVAVARAAAGAEWALRDPAADAWRALRGAARHPLDGLGEILGSSRPARVWARALRVMAEVDLIEIGASELVVRPADGRRDLALSPGFRRARDRLAEAEAFLDLAQTLDLSPEAAGSVI